MEPAIISTYAGSGDGKSVSALYAAPQGLFLTPARGGLIAARALLTKAVREEEVRTLDQARERAAVILKEAAYKDPTNRIIVLDDFSILAERSHLAIEESGVKGWDIWQRLARQVQKLRDFALNETVTVILGAHIAPPKTTDTGAFIPGGPLMPSQKLSGTLPHVSSLVLRGGKDPFVQPPEWPGIWRVDVNDGNWLTKDRYCVLGPESPMNLREILVRAKEIGHAVVVPRRLPGLEWLDVAAEQVAQGLAQGAFSTPLAAAEALGRAPGLPSNDPRLLRWAWQDGVARYRLRTKGAGQGLYSAFTS